VNERPASDTSENKSTQTKITARTVAGRDANTYEITYNVHPTRLQALYSRLEMEIKEDLQVASTLPLLERFTVTQADEVVGLTQKLADGGLGCQTEHAMGVKELYVKNFTRYQMYESAQRIHAMMLSVIESRFHRFVKPSLGHVTTEQIMDLVQEKVVAAIERELGDNPLDICNNQIDGMVYFLTGKCLLKWKP
jgi:hypothetical protein